MDGLLEGQVLDGLYVSSIKLLSSKLLAQKWTEYSVDKDIFLNLKMAGLVSINLMNFLQIRSN